MEFYKTYIDDFGCSATKALNADVKNNQQWRSEVVGYASVVSKVGFTIEHILVRWVGLSETPFKENEE